ncbi:MAG TPA: hypothetical protein VFI72_13710, partial [Candidatus Angelobacter sp.]|nr:hypothetical protein [Candidatus Angelobacter sp.]
PAFLKPIDGGGWRDVHHVHNREEFFRAYDQSRDLCMVLQREVDFTEYFRCFVIGRDKVLILPYDPRRPYHERYLKEAPPTNRRLLKRLRADALTLCRALGYDFNTVEFAVRDGVPYAIDFMNPAPEADLQTLGPVAFDWVVEAVAALAIKKAKAAQRSPALRADAFLKDAAPSRPRQPRARRRPAQQEVAEPA